MPPVLDALDGLLGRQAARDVLLKEQADDLSVRRSQFRADDDGERGDVSNGKGAADGVMIRDGDNVYALALAGSNEGFGG